MTISREYQQVLAQVREAFKKSHPNYSAKLEADARALWAVRVLDAWAQETHGVWRLVNDTGPWGVQWVVSLTDAMTKGCAETPDAARLAAAEAVFPELPADVRAKLGERP